MARTEPKSHYLREWRERAELTLEGLVDALDQRGFRTTHATLSRIERFKLPYSQALLEALAAVYQRAPSALLEPPDDADNVTGMWRAIPERDRPQVREIMRTFIPKSSDG